MERQVDHVTVAGRELDHLVDAFKAAGFEVTYGGEHSNEITHMSIIGFRDGSYIELISTIEPGQIAPKWNGPISENGGPCAWAVGVDDIEAASAEFHSRGVDVDGPHEQQRTRADGTVAQWEFAFLGSGEPGSTLPFLISDRTPRERRVQPDSVMESTPIVGIDTVVLGVAELGTAVERCMTAFDVAEPTTSRLTELTADVAVFEDQPFALAQPREQNWFADRIAEFGPLPVAYLLGRERDTDVRFDDLESGSIGTREIQWLPVTDPVGYRYLGLVETTD